MTNPLPQLNPDFRVKSLPESFYEKVRPQALSNPYLVAFSPVMADLLGIEPEQFQDASLIEMLSGSRIAENSDPLAMLYAGHQFGVYVPQLGDGRAMTLGEIEGKEGCIWELQLKGSGSTPFSRMGDGRAVLRSTIREFLASEALAALGIPTTRALCITASQDPVYRETVETAAVLTRLAPSHLRFGNFEVFFYRQQYDELKVLADFVIEHFYPDCWSAANPYLELFRQVCERSAQLIAQWQLFGFTHGVLNSDNMSILGLTIDYGPYGFVESFRSAFVCNHTDAQGRYAYDQQPRVGLFNLTCLAQAMLPLINADDGQAAAEQAKSLLVEYQSCYENFYYQGMTAKLGLDQVAEGDQRLADDLFKAMEGEVDFTNFFRHLCDFERDTESVFPDETFGNRIAIDAWLERYRNRLEIETTPPTARQAKMRAVNPCYVLRNYLVQQAIDRAEAGDFSEVGNLQTLLQTPFEQQEGFQSYTVEAPKLAQETPLSCSS